VRRLPAGLTLLLVLSACGGGSGGTLTPADAATVSFRAYHAALSSKDFAKACSLSTKSITATLLAKLAAANLPAKDCTDGLAKAYAQAGSANQVEQVEKSLKIVKVTAQGDSATVAWTVQLRGKPTQATTQMRKEDGAWKLDSTS
jgi:hypothetical protein